MRRIVDERSLVGIMPWEAVCLGWIKNGRDRYIELYGWSCSLARAETPILSSCARLEAGS